MGDLQTWLYGVLTGVPAVARFMRTAWAWPTLESVHFIGLTLLFGTIAVWDARLLGRLARVPVADVHRLVPFAVLGFALNVGSGLMFLLTEPDQYVYNPAFHLKMLLVALAGVNVLVFYLFAFPRVNALAPGADTPRFAKVSAVVSLTCWTGVIVSGRLITFYRPFSCAPGEAIAFLLRCVP